MIAQVEGAIVAAGVLIVIASGRAGFEVAQGLAANDYGEAEGEPEIVGLKP